MLTMVSGGSDNGTVRILRVFVVLVLSVHLLSCSGDDEFSGELEKRPDTVSWDFRQVNVDGNRRVIAEAEKVEVFDDQDLTVFTQARLQEYDEGGDLLREGSAEEIRIVGENEGSAAGNIVVRDIAEDATMNAEALNWSDEERTLTGDGPVDITGADGLSVSGSGFVADLARDSYRYADGATGVVIADDE